LLSAREIYLPLIFSMIKNGKEGTIMQITMNIEAGQIGDTVIELFRNLSQDKKEELALQILREWLKAPEFFETPNYEQLVIDEFRSGKRGNGAYDAKYNKDTPEEMIRSDYKFRDAVKGYKNSKQVMVEEIKNSIIAYYKQELSKEIATSETIEKIKKETFEIIAKDFPQLIYQTMLSVFVGNLHGLGNQINETHMRQWNIESMLNQALNK